MGRQAQTPGCGGASLHPAVCSCLRLVQQPVNHREVDLEFLPTDASPRSPSSTCLLGDTLRSLLCTLVQWLWLCPFMLPIPPPTILLCSGIEFLGGDGIVSAYLGLVACPGCSCLPWEEGGSGSQDLPFGELLTPIWSGCKQVTFAEILRGETRHCRGGLLVEWGRLRLRFYLLVKYFIWLS